MKSLKKKNKRNNKPKLSKRIKPLTDITKYIAVFHNDRGDQIGKKKFGKYDSTINFKGRSFNVVLGETYDQKDKTYKRATLGKRKGLFVITRFLYYNINDPMPLCLEKNVKPIINSKIYNAQLETKLAKDFNKIGDNPLSKLLTDPKVIMVIVIGIAVSIYFANGGALW